VKRQGQWYFDSKAGHDEILFRRIGANELDAIRICHGYVEAQKQYALTAHGNPPVHQYAQKIISSPGQQDGLFWKDPDGSPGGPISEGVARALEEGYSEKGALTTDTISKFFRHKARTRSSARLTMSLME
jgi:DUF2950 family protein